ncbi:GDSL-like Lipase/Acylhydrolase family protein [Rhodococcus tukisamuensis]|uniref:GDSL-like Lipase/Acylhydrolase family protein n=1 Tax=Rhodococcus tukisamuensis TaxID=168276 RepID=A0A1G7ALF6_9NOCA|nr:GDSL-like Lipase/Acylhydrolase family protein [Rhodococcus tukisamuensis]
MTRRRRALPIVSAAAAVILVAALATASAIARRSNEEAAPPRSLRIAVVGDDYTAGRQNRVVWPTLLAQRTGWSVSNFALPGAGYLADGAGGYAFTYQVDRARGADPDFILVVGGLKDTGFPEVAPINAGAIAAIHKIVLGGERPLLIGPTWYETPVPEAVSRVSDAVQSAAKSTGVPYLDALDPPWLSPRLMQADLAYPTDEGQSLLADRVAAWVRTEVVR